MHVLTDAVNAVVFSVLSVLMPMTVLALLCRFFVPVIGTTIWQGYCRLLRWLVVAPFRLLRLLVREATRRH